MKEAALRLVSVQTGLPRTRGEAGSRDPMRAEWTSAIFKQPVSGRVFLSREGLEGDGQADRASHGGPDRAVLMYAAAHYPAWRDELGIDLPAGAFGENFTLEGVDETTACVGDTLALGEAVVQISQPRGPCWKIARRWERRDLLERVVATGRTGWYGRVAREGFVWADAGCVRIERPCPGWTVARVAALRSDVAAPVADLEFLAACPWLSRERRRRFAAVAARRRSEAHRVPGSPPAAARAPGA